MILKEYQEQALAQVRQFLKHLASRREEVLEMDPAQALDWVAAAWRDTGKSESLTPRRNGLGHPLPCYCLKVPTGGGKTLLAVKVIDLVNSHFRRRRSGVVLWVVPTTQIYNQTLSALRDRDHPYRQQLDVASANHTLILEKTDRFRSQDANRCLCILLLMLPSANRETKDQLRMFRDSGGFESFFPGDDNIEKHAEVLREFPNLDVFRSAGGWNHQVKTSLGNTLRTLAPLIIIDEGHKAYSRKAKSTLEGFNPCMIVELSATPPKDANVLVEITGQALNREEMIKLDLNIVNKASPDWRDTLLAAIEQRNALEAKAGQYEAETGEYIRPICLIQVERTSDSQRGMGFIHADDARDYLLAHPGINADHVAVKTSTHDDLKDLTGVGGLLARDCPTRYVITKRALQEGWDCSFAYVLAILSNPSAKTGLTQLVGRVLRQPYAKKTRVRALDESYVFCFQRRGQDMLKEVRRGFDMEGLQGLQGKIVEQPDGDGQPTKLVVSTQRDRFRKSTRDLVLPAFMVREDRRWRLVHYEEDILSRLPWDEADVTPLFDLKLGSNGHLDLTMRAGLDGTAEVEDADTQGASVEKGIIDHYFAARHLSDTVPNPWRAADFSKQVFGALLAKHPREKVATNYMFILEELRKRLDEERDRLSQCVFRRMLESGAMRFIVVAEDLGFNRLPADIESRMVRQANREDGTPYRASLFEQVSETELNELENKVATCLDKQARLFFWHRNRARRDYFVQGWRPGRIYADFVFTLKADDPDANDELHQVFVMETKGMHLKEFEDTAYKRSVFDICTEHASKTDWAEFVPAMKSKSMRFEIVDEDEWEHRLNDLLG